jgi:lipopolysaccharide transport system ATP-binding protein
MFKEKQVAVRLTNVSKNYVTYAKPRYWLADFLGLGRFLKEGRHYRSFWALRDINLEIPMGGKFAFIGCNGAGKSTLLRIISDNIASTTGTVAVNGHCEALMELGTGFNAEFTGRENIYTSLAYKGITGKAADEKFWEVVDFSELDEFIDQPVKTYSSGMYLRLAFSVATVVEPEILIIDEILAAGDMYFQSKCLERIEELTSGPGVTVLFVSHDLGSARRLCDTFVWIDRGHIVKIGPSADLQADYEDFIRKQQETRMRARNLRLRQKTLSALQEAGEDGVHLLGRFVLEADGSKAIGPHIDFLRLYVRGVLAEEIRVCDAMDDNAAESTWGPSQRQDGRLTRAVEPGRNGVDGAKFALFLAHDDFTADDFCVELEVNYQDSSPLPCHLELDAGLAGLKRMLTLEHTADKAWKTARLTIPRWVYAPPGSTEAKSSARKQQADGEVAKSKAVNGTAEVPSEKRFGTGQVLIDRVQFFNERGEESYIFQHRRPMSVMITYHAEDASVIGTTMVWAVSFMRIDGVESTTMISLADGLDFVVQSEGKLIMKIDSLLLCDGTFRFSTALFSKLHLHGYNPHFTTSSFLYDMHARSYEIAVEGTHRAELWLFRHPVKWEVLE